MRISLRKLIDFFEYIVVLLVILDFNTVYSRTININYHLTEITAIMLLLLLLARWHVYGFKRTSLKHWINYHAWYYIFAIVLLIASVGNEQKFSYISRFLMILPMLDLLFVGYAQTGKVMELIEKYTSVLTILAAISLFFWLFGSQLHIIRPTGTILAHWGRDCSYPSYFGLYVERQRQLFLFFDGLRNQGIFCEAPMHSVALVIAIAYDTFLRPGYSSRIHTKGQRHSGRIRQSILIITLLTTVTTTGMIVFLLIIGLNYMLIKPRTKFVVILKWIITLFISAFILYLAVHIFIMKSTSASWTVRSDDFQAGFRGWLHSPIYGSGYGTYAGIDPYRSSSRFLETSRPSFSNSIMLVLAQGGIIYFMIYCVPVVKGIKVAFVEKDYRFLAFSIIFCVEFTFTIITNTILLLLLIAMFYGVSIEHRMRNKM